MITFYKLNYCITFQHEHVCVFIRAISTYIGKKQFIKNQIKPYK